MPSRRPWWRGRLSVAETDAGRPGVVLMCVGTPIGDDGPSDLSQLDGALAGLRGSLRPRRHPGDPEHPAGRRDATGARGDGTADASGSSPTPNSCARARRSTISPIRPGSSSADFPEADPARARRGHRPVRAARGASLDRRRRGGRDHQERGERVPRPQVVVHQRDRVAVRGGRARTSTRSWPGSRPTHGSAERTCSRASASAAAACPRS